ncbi:hypothetical protein M2138_000351 [Dysgonomonadaceae bacterium PH5-43]|nr:hypothetical protein [Dysgonomonadaceae bacterium PH5-43]
MNKKLAEIIAGLIPHKLTRNQWRGKLRFGLIESIQLKKFLRKNKDVPTKYYIAVCAIAKNEGPYFKEWIDWHQKLGIDKFFIYDNESSDNTKEILTPYIESGLIEYTYWEGEKEQLATYDDCLRKHRLDCSWIAMIDLDEFIVPSTHKTISEVLFGLEQFSVVEINWLIYGSGGAKNKELGNVMDRFKKHSLPNHKLNRYIKSIVNPRKVYSFIGSHEVARISGKAADPLGNPIKKCFRDREPQQDILRINHYAVKSHEEFLEKQEKGRASGRTRKISMEYFHRFDLNDIEEQ